MLGHMDHMQLYSKIAKQYIYKIVHVIVLMNGSAEYSVEWGFEKYLRVLMSAV